MAWVNSRLFIELSVVAYRLAKGLAKASHSGSANEAGARIVAKHPVPRYLIRDNNHRDWAISGPEDA
jgi:hypothetical protein